MNSNLQTGRKPLLAYQNWPQLPPSELFTSEATKCLTFVESLLYAPKVVDTNHLPSLLWERLKYESARLAEARDEMDGLAAAYNRYRDLKTELEKRLTAVKRTAFVLGKDWIEVTETFSSDPPTKGRPFAGKWLSDTEWKRGIPLWESIEAILQCVDEARVFEIEDFLNSRNEGQAEISRQAIDSAINAHPKVFKVRKRGAEKYISLKSRVP